MKHNFFEISPFCEYGRSPVEVKPIVDYSALENFNENSPILKNNIFKAVKGRKWNDLIEFETSQHFLISERLKITIEEHKLTGIQFFPIKIKLKPNKKYFGFHLTHTAGPIINKKEASFGFEPIEFDESTWDGSDFFTLEGTLLTVISQRAKEILEKGKYSNLEIEPI